MNDGSSIRGGLGCPSSAPWRIRLVIELRNPSPNDSRRIGAGIPSTVGDAGVDTGPVSVWLLTLRGRLLLSSICGVAVAPQTNMPANKSRKKRARAARRGAVTSRHRRASLVTAAPALRSLTPQCPRELARPRPRPRPRPHPRPHPHPRLPYAPSPAPPSETDLQPLQSVRAALCLPTQNLHSHRNVSGSVSSRTRLLVPPASPTP